MTSILLIMCMYNDEFYFKNPNFVIFACILKSFKSLIFSSQKKFFEKMNNKKAIEKYQEIK